MSAFVQLLGKVF